MNTFFGTRLRLISGLAVAVTLAACSSGGLPSDVSQSASAPTVPPVGNTYLPLVLTPSGGRYALTQGDTVPLMTTGGKAPYAYQASGGAVAGDGSLYSASAVGTFTVTVTDQQQPPQSSSVQIVVSAKAPPPAPTPTPSPTPTPAPTPPPPPPASQAIYRAFNTIHGLHQIQHYPQVTGAGWVAEGEMYRTFVTGAAGMQAVYTCVISNPSVNFQFQSVDPACEGFPRFATIGYVYQTQQPNTIALVRFSKLYRYNGYQFVDHIDIKIPDLANPIGPAGYTPDGTLGFVPN